jgi:hypothetical protein
MIAARSGGAVVAVSAGRSAPLPSVLFDDAVVHAEPVADAAGAVGVVERAVAGQVPEVADQGEQFRPAVTAGVGWWEVVDTAGLRPVERPAVSSSRAGTAPTQSGIFPTTPFLTRTVTTLRRTAFMRPSCATTSTEAPASLVPAGLEAADAAYIERLAGVTERDPTPCAVAHPGPGVRCRLCGR